MSRVATSRIPHLAQQAAGSAGGFVPFFIVSLLFALTFGAGLGALTLASMTLPYGLLAGSALEAAKIAHGHAQVFAFAALFVMGVAYHTVPRFRRTELVAPALARATLWFQATGVLAVAWSVFANGPGLSGLRLVGSMALLLGALGFGWSMHRTLAAGAAPRQPLVEGFLRAGCAWLVVAAALDVADAVGGGSGLRARLWEAALWGFAASWLLGMSLRVLPAFLGLALTPPDRLGVPFLAYQAAVLTWVAGATASAWPLRFLAGALLTAALPALLVHLGIARLWQPSAADDRRHLRMVRAAYAWLLVATALGPGWTAVAALAGSAPPALVLDFARHAFTLGFLTQMIMGVTARIVPVITGAPPWTPGWRNAVFALLNLAVLARALQLIVATTALDGVWPWVSLSGLLGLGAFAAFTCEVVLSRRRATAAVPVAAIAAAADIGPETLVSVVLERVPGALDMLLERGLQPLADPAVRAAVAHTVTLRHASRMHAFDVDELTRALNAALAQSERESGDD